MKKLDKKTKNITIFIASGLFLAIFLIFVAILTYVFNLRENPVAKTTATLFHYPATISFQTGIISIKQLNKRLDAIKNFYTNQDFSKLGYRVDLTSNDGKKRLKIKEKYLLEKLIEEKIIENLAHERNIKITNQTVEKAVSRKIKEYSSEELLSQNIKHLYNWNLKDFKNNIVKPDLYKENLKSFVEKNEKEFLNSKKIITSAKEELDDGHDFSEVVQKYSQGESAQKKGELGWFRKEQVLSEISDAIFSLQKGETSSTLESSLGYHIIKIEDKKIENEIEYVKLRQIFVRNENFGDWLNQQKKEFNFFILIPDYTWNEEKGILEFSNKEMQEFEEKTFQNSTGDPLFNF